jgi:hypothetical protein
MPGGRPGMLDKIELELRGAAVKEILELGCACSKCPLRPAAIVHLARADGSHSLFPLCKDHLADVRGKHPSSLGDPKLQTFFLF